MSGNVTEDSLRFGLAADASAKASATAVVIAGDLVNTWNGGANDAEGRNFSSVFPGRFRSAADVHLIPGNHDIDCNGEATNWQEELGWWER